jgi:hypothetical protein
VIAASAPALPPPPPPKPRPKPPAPRPPDTAPPPTEAPKPPDDSALRQQAQAQLTYKGKILQAIREQMPVFTSKGTVTVAFEIGSAGEIVQLRLVASSGRDSLDASALRLVRAIRPGPPPDGHYAVTVDINFLPPR